MCIYILELCQILNPRIVALIQHLSILVPGFDTRAKVRKSPITSLPGKHMAPLPNAGADMMEPLPWVLNDNRSFQEPSPLPSRWTPSSWQQFFISAANPYYRQAQLCCIRAAPTHSLSINSFLLNNVCCFARGGSELSCSWDSVWTAEVLSKCVRSIPSGLELPTRTTVQIHPIRCISHTEES